jgi:predicted ribosomally synthesized peptide with SipW-like signal peptide
MKASSARPRVTPAKILGTLAAVTLVGVLGVAGTTAALSDTTDNELNEFDAGEVDLEDNDSGSFMYDIEDAEPGDSIERCIQISYTGTMDSDVALFMATPVDTVAPYVDMLVEVGTQSSPVFPDCTGFTPAQTLHDGTLADFQATHGSAAAGAVYSPNGVGTPWEPGDTVVYRVTLELSTDTRGPGENFSGAHTYTWQADSV